MIEVRKVFLRTSATEYRLEYAYILQDDYQEFAFSPMPVNLDLSLTYDEPFTTEAPELWIISDLETGDPMWAACAPFWVETNCYTTDPYDDPVKEKFELENQIDYWNSSEGRVVPVTVAPAEVPLYDYISRFGEDFASHYEEGRGLNNLTFRLKYDPYHVISAPVYRDGKYVDPAGFYVSINGHLFGEATGTPPYLESTIVDLETGEVIETFQSYRGPIRNTRLDDTLVRGYLKAAERSVEHNYNAPVSPEQWEQRRLYREFQDQHNIDYVEFCKTGRNLKCFFSNKK